MTFRKNTGNFKNSPNIFLESERIKQGKCYCMPPRDASPILSAGNQAGEGCTKLPESDHENLSGVEGNPSQQ